MKRFFSKFFIKITLLYNFFLILLESSYERNPHTRHADQADDEYIGPPGPFFRYSSSNFDVPGLNKYEYLKIYFIDQN